MLFFLLLSIPVIIIFTKWYQFKNSVYSQQTNEGFINVLFNKGKYGEYLISKVIQKNALPTHKQLFNLYIRKINSEDLTEIDLVYIDRTGIYVVESKNYSGWIFGKEKQLKWTQTLPNKQKFSFYNPVKQNDTHIRALQQKLQLEAHYFHSVIVFSERCTLKSIAIDRQDVTVLKRNDLSTFINNHSKQKQLLSFTDIEEIYKKLLPTCSVTEQVKKQHVASIQIKFKR